MRMSHLLTALALYLPAACDRAAGPAGVGGGESPFDPVAFFDGHVRSRGVMEDRSGAPTGWIVTDCVGHKDGQGGLRMVQHLSFQDATAQERVWQVRRSGPGRFEATASDMVGSALGDTSGGAFHWRWVLARAPGERPFDVTMDQWIYPLGDGSVMIRSTISKFGFILSEVSERFAHVLDAPVAAAVPGAGEAG